LQKIVYILTVIFLCYSCSVTRMQRKNGRKAQGVENKEFIYKKIENQNLTAKSFFIEKAEFNIKTEEGEKRGLGTIRFIMPGKFLISIKSSSGIEVVRIFLTGDSVLANDRINKKMYYASASYLKSKYGLTTSILPVILGDYINDEKLDSNNVKCVNDTLRFREQ